MIRFCQSCSADTLPIRGRCGFCNQPITPNPIEARTMNRALAVGLLFHLTTSKEKGEAK